MSRPRQNGEEVERVSRCGGGRDALGFMRCRCACASSSISACTCILQVASPRIALRQVTIKILVPAPYPSSPLRLAVRTDGYSAAMGAAYTPAGDIDNDPAQTAELGSRVPEAAERFSPDFDLRAQELGLTCDPTCSSSAAIMAAGATAISRVFPVDEVKFSSIPNPRRRSGDHGYPRSGCEWLPPVGSAERIVALSIQA